MGDLRSVYAVRNQQLHALYHKLLAEFGPEFYILLEAPLEVIERASTSEIARFIGRVRTGNITVEPGYDGQYGKIL